MHIEARREYLTESLTLVLTDPPYNTRGEHNRDNFAQAALSDDDVKQFAEVAQQVCHVLYMVLSSVLAKNVFDSIRF